MYETLLWRQDGGVATLTLNRPEVLNAFNDTMHAEFRAALERAAGDPAVRCLVITGAGRAFCGGQDLRTFPDDPPPGSVTEFLENHYNREITLVRTMPKPVLAAVNGPAAGAGVSLALACDLRIASERAVFAEAFVRVGLVLDAGSSYFLPRLVGFGRALEMALTGDPVDARRALEWGLVNRVAPEAEFEAAVAAWAKQLAAGPTATIGLLKQQLNRAVDLDLDAALALEAELQEIAIRGAEHREGRRAFLEKRPPRFEDAR